MRQSVFDRVAAPLDYHKYFHLDTFVKSEIITAQLGKASGESGFRSFRKAWAISKFFACFDSGFMKSGVVQFMQAFKIWDHDLVSVFQSLWTLYIYIYIGDLFFTSFHFFQSHVATQELRGISSPPYKDRVHGLHIHVRTTWNLSKGDVWHATAHVLAWVSTLIKLRREGNFT